MKEKIVVPLVLILGSHTIMADAINEIFAHHTQKGVSSINEQVGKASSRKEFIDIKTGQLSTWRYLK